MDSGTEAKPESDGREPEGSDFVERWLLPFLHDSALWPILIVVLVHATILIAPALIFAVRDRSVGAILGLVLFAILTFEGIRNEVRARHRPGALSVLAGIVWVAAGIGAWAAARVGLF